MTHRTKTEIKDASFGPAVYPPYTLTIPAGTKVEPCNDGSGQYWVSEFGWIPHTTQRHDASHYGLRVNAENIGTSD